MPEGVKLDNGQLKVQLQIENPKISLGQTKANKFIQPKTNLPPRAISTEKKLTSVKPAPPQV